MNVQIEESWKEVLKEEFEKTYFQHIATFLKAEKACRQNYLSARFFIF